MSVNIDPSNELMYEKEERGGGEGDKMNSNLKPDNNTLNTQLTKTQRTNGSSAMLCLITTFYHTNDKSAIRNGDGARGNVGRCYQRSIRGKERGFREVNMGDYLYNLKNLNYFYNLF